MNKITMIVVAIVILAIVGFGGYKLYHHFNKPAMAPVAVAPVVSPTSGTMQNSVYKMMTDSKGVSYVTDDKGMTLYTYSKDTSGVSNCTGTCIAHWPAYGPTTMPAQSTLPAHVTVITRSDKTLQYAWDGMPLYYFVGDTKAGDVTGDGVNGFMLAK